MSPKELYQKDAQRTNRHKDLVDAQFTQEAVLAAFNQYCWAMRTGVNPGDNVTNNAKREGAREFVEVFMTLANPPKVQTPTKEGLNYA